ncbi:MAG: hypothetical protein ED859_15340 [Desulfuromonadales bacterium]|nr:MAG: hypothetical protein ED859_15340 [Desulfuromonadales bacterium]
MKRLLVALAILCLAGCGPWVKTEGPYSADPLNVAVDLPQGWMRQNTGKHILMTKDGVLLQVILIKRMDLTQEKQFQYTKKRVTGEMLPQEVAEVILDDFQSDTDNRNLQVEENVPATIGGNQGFKVRFSHGTELGLHYRKLCYGFLKDGWLYELLYSAPRRHYFDRDMDDFEKVVRSFRLVK